MKILVTGNSYVVKTDILFDDFILAKKYDVGACEVCEEEKLSYGIDFCDRRFGSLSRYGAEFNAISDDGKLILTQEIDEDELAESGIDKKTVIARKLLKMKEFLPIITQQIKDSAAKVKSNLDSVKNDIEIL